MEGSVKGRLNLELPNLKVPSWKIGAIIGRSIFESPSKCAEAQDLGKPEKVGDERRPELVLRPISVLNAQNDLEKIL